MKGQFLVSKEENHHNEEAKEFAAISSISCQEFHSIWSNNAGYGSAKAAQAHLSRLLAAELGADKIRVNIVNPDAVIADSNMGLEAGQGSESYGITVEELPAYYAKETLLNEMILPDDIANACFAFVGGLLSKSTGNILNRMVEYMGFVR